MSEDKPESELSPYDSLKTHLIGLGHSAQDVEVIMKKLAEYDHNMMRDSVFDSIAQGAFNLEGFIAQVLEEPRTAPEVDPTDET